MPSKSLSICSFQRIFTGLLVSAGVLGPPRSAISLVPVTWGSKDPWFLVGLLPLSFSLSKSPASKIIVNAPHLFSSVLTASPVNSLCRDYIVYTISLLRKYKGEINRSFEQILDV